MQARYKVMIGIGIGIIIGLIALDKMHIISILAWLATPQMDLTPSSRH